MHRFCVLLLLLVPVSASAFLPDDEIGILQKTVAGWPVGDRIAFWAEQFTGVPYDTDPLGAYVRRNVVVADDRVDCMYHVFRSMELALGSDPADAVMRALDLRFHDHGRVKDGTVLNYEGRFRFGEEMIRSGKWGREITADLGHTVLMIEASGGRAAAMVPKRYIPLVLDRLRSGDIVFFIKDPARRVEGELVGHLGILKTEGNTVYLISAFGQKNRGGAVEKALFSAYSEEMPFIGIRVTRWE